MKITLGRLRHLISEAAPSDPELAALPEQIRLQHITASGKSRVWVGDRDKINSSLIMLGLAKPLRLALMQGTKALNDALAAALRSRGAITSDGAPKVAAEAPPGEIPRASAAPAGERSERMTPKRAQEWMDYMQRRFVRNTLKAEGAPVDAEQAQVSAEGFFSLVPHWERWARLMGQDKQAVQDKVADMLLDGVKAAEQRAASVSATPPKASKETYKVYPGGKKWGAPVVTRVKGKVFKGPSDSKFKPGEQAAVAPEGDKLRVKKTDSDHAQMWEPELVRFSLRKRRFLAAFFVNLPNNDSSIVPHCEHVGASISSIPPHCEHVSEPSNLAPKPRFPMFFFLLDDGTP